MDQNNFKNAWERPQKLMQQLTEIMAGRNHLKKKYARQHTKQAKTQYVSSLRPLTVECHELADKIKAEIQPSYMDLVSFEQKQSQIQEWKELKEQNKLLRDNNLFLENELNRFKLQQQRQASQDSLTIEKLKNNIKLLIEQVESLKIDKKVMESQIKQMRENFEKQIEKLNFEKQIKRQKIFLKVLKLKQPFEDFKQQYKKLKNTFQQFKKGIHISELVSVITSANQRSAERDQKVYERQQKLRQFKRGYWQLRQTIQNVLRLKIQSKDTIIAVAENLSQQLRLNFRCQTIFAETHIPALLPSTKKDLLQQLQNIQIRPYKTNLIYRFDALNPTSFHKYVDDKPHIIVLMALSNGNTLALYLQHYFLKQKIQGKAMLFNLTMGYFLRPKKSLQLATNDEQCIRIGNKEIVINFRDRTLFAALGEANCIFDMGETTLKKFLGDNNKRQPIDTIQIHQLAFQ